MPEGSSRVRDYMSDRLVTVDPDATVAEALSLMARRGVQELPVMTNSQLRGWVSYRTLVRRGNVPPHTKVASVMESPPLVHRDADLAEAADLMIRNNAPALAVMDGKGHIVGVLSRTDVLRASPDMDGLAHLPVEAVMNTELETVDEAEPVDRAVSRLRAHHISQLLVLDRNGRLAGYVALQDLLPALVAEHGESDRGKAGSRNGAGQRKKGQVTVQGFVRDAPTVERAARLKDAVQAMHKRRSNFVAVVENGAALGVLSRSNVVERVARLRRQDGVLCQIVGLSDHVDTSELDRIYELAQRALKKISTEVKVEFLTLHYKVYKAKSEGDSKYALSLHLSTEGRFIVQKADAWGPIEATQAALEALERRVAALKEMRLERRKTRSARKTSFYTAARA